MNEVVGMKIEGLEELEHTLGELTGRAIFGKLIELAGNTLVARASKYPHPGPWNTAPATHGAWYHRGHGTRYKRLDGVITGRKTSEVLDKQWSNKRGGSANNPTATVENRASYATYVHGLEQAGIHVRRGWKNLYTMATTMLPEMQRKVAAAVDRQLRR